MDHANNVGSEQITLNSKVTGFSKTEIKKCIFSIVIICNNQGLCKSSSHCQNLKMIRNYKICFLSASV